MHGTLKHTITRFRKPIPVFPSGQKTHAARDGNGSAARNAKRQFFRCSDGTEEFLRQTPRGVPKRPKDRPAQPAIRSRKDGEALPPIETTTTARYARPAESGRKDKEPDRLTDRHATGIQKSGHSRSACAESWNAPFYSSSAADPNGHTAESIGQAAPQSSGSALKPASETARTTASEDSSVSIVSNFSGEARSIDHSSGLAILFSCSPILATHPPHLALVLNLFFIG